MLNNTLKSNVKYHDWIKTHKNNIFPKEFKNSYEFDIQTNPQNYVKAMIYMCEQIEKEGTKLFQFFPLRTDIIIKHIQIDTKSLIEIFIRDDKNDLLKDVEGNKDKIWNLIFKLDNPIFKQKNFVFDYVINTDCYTTSIKMLNKNNVESEKVKKTNMKNKKNENAKLTKDMNEEEKEQFKKNEEIKKKNKETEFRLKLKEKKDKEKEEFKKLPKEEQKKLKDKQKEDIKKQKLESGEECQYIDDLNDNQLKELDNNDFICIDIGIRVPAYMKSKKGIRFRYTNKKHAFRIRRFKYRKSLKNIRI